MQTNYFTSPLENLPDGADPSVNTHDMIYPQDDRNTSEGDEFLNDLIRMKEQPYQNPLYGDEERA